MILKAPNYYSQFHCIASKCKDSCCSAGWEIDIDSETKKYYDSVSGVFGKKLSENIANTNPPHFILNKNNQCPFLNENKLCDIYIKLGEERLCQICADHPRFYEWFENIKEAGIGLCCEEAARIILEQKDDFTIVSTNISDINPDYIEEADYNIELYDYLYNSRQKIISYINSSKSDINKILKNVLWYSHTLQQDIDSGLLDDEEIFDIETSATSSMKDIINYFLTLEYIDENWINYLKDSIKKYENNSCNIDIKNFEKSNPQICKYLKNISLYFIWRYFLKSVFDEDVLSKVKLMYISTCMLKYLFYFKWIENGCLTPEDCINIVKKYSEEIEYSEDNVQTIYEDSYDLEIFLTENLLGLLN